ncbi:helix-turn-helix domain-containing protein (plasmid) [Haloimpatiens sp. FM7330]|uniref:helix-turn-helix domain-containing protein n=1 Tax=Haloimpatiens sp. FM7330 TaxID=3298610 RepID=UPI003635D380
MDDKKVFECKESYSIGEVCNIIECEDHVLRYIEKVVNLDIKRNEHGERIYTIEDINNIKFIFKLKEEGLNYAAIKKVLEHNSEVAAEMEEKEEEEEKEESKELMVESEKLEKFMDVMGNLMDEKIQPIYDEISTIKDQNTKLKEDIEKEQEKHFRQLDDKIGKWREEHSKKKSLFSRIFG